MTATAPIVPKEGAKGGPVGLPDVFAVRDGGVYSQNFGFLLVADGPRKRILTEFTGDHGGRSIAQNAALSARYCPEADAYHVLAVRGCDDADTIRRAIEGCPWRAEPWFIANLRIWAEHVPHSANGNPGQLAYFASPEHRARGRVTETRPGRYLKKFFGHILTPEQIEHHAVQWDNCVAPLDAVITTDPDEIERAYVGGPPSCMKGDASDFSSHCHPVRVYGNSPDVALAYIGDLDEAKGRAVVWPGKKIWARIYGDEKRTKDALERIGYREGTTTDWKGARLCKIEARNGEYVMPYVDRIGRVDDDGDYFALRVDGDFDAQNTSGLMEVTPRCTCALCGDRVDEDDSYYIEGEGDVCSHCLHSHFTFCHGLEEYVSYHEKANLSPRSARRGDFSLAYVQTDDDWFLCEETDEWWHVNDSDCITMDDGRVVCEEWAEDNAFFCVASEEWVELSGLVHRPAHIELSGGGCISRAHFDNDNDAIAAWIVENDRDTEEDEIAGLVKALREDTQARVDVAA